MASHLDDLLCFNMANRLYLSDEGRIDIDTRLKVHRSIQENFEKGLGHEDIQTLKDRIKAYIKQLETLNLKDWEVQSLENSFCLNLFYFIRSLVYVLSAVTLAIPGFLYLLPGLWYLRTSAERKRKEALKNSSVKIKGSDVVASWKILAGLVLFLVYYNVTMLLVFVFYTFRHYSGFVKICVVQCLLNLGVFLYIIMCFQLTNGVNTHFRICMIRCFKYLYWKTIKRVRAERKELKADVKATMDRYSIMTDKSMIIRRNSLKSKDIALNEIEAREIFGTLEEFMN